MQGKHNRETAVLFAGVDPPRGAPAPAFARLVDTLGEAVDLSGGRVLNRRAGEVMALFATPDAAALAAVRMHTYAETLAPATGGLNVRVGFHSGPVGQRGEEVFGDTVNLALAIVDQAKSGQIVTTQQTASSLCPTSQERVKPLAYLGRVMLGELVWRSEDEGMVITAAPARAARVRLLLCYGDTTLLRRREGDSITLGRGTDCDLVLAGRTASRRHCTIERRNSVFMLKDHSANGTRVIPEGREPILLRNEALVLSGRGVIQCGPPREPADEPVKYLCEQG